MGESWSDLAAVESSNEYGFVPIADENRFAVGPYVTGDKRAGIRNYGMNVSPLNFSNVGYDFVCNARRRAPRSARRSMPTARSGARRTSPSGRRSPARYDGTYRRRTPRSRRVRRRARRPRSPARGTVAGSSSSSMLFLLAGSGSPHDARRPRRDAGGRPDSIRRRQPGPALEHVREPRLRVERYRHRAERHRSSAELRVANRDRGDADLRAGQRWQPGRRRAAVRRPLRGSDDAGRGHRSGDVAGLQPQADRPAPTRCSRRRPATGRSEPRSS